MPTISTDVNQVQAHENPEFIDFFILAVRKKKFIIGFPLVVALLTAGITMLLPDVYKASAKLLPPQPAQSSASALLSQLSGVAGVASGVGGLKNPNDLYLGMLRSRAIGDKLIKRFDLLTVYDTTSLEKARRRLAENTMVTSGKEGLITIDVEDENRKLVPQLANGYVEELLKLTKVLAVTEAGQRRVFFERQLEMSKANLEKAELTLKDTIGSRGVISVDSQSRAVVETVGRLRAQISAKEIQLGSMRAFVTTNNPEFKRAQEELHSLRAELFKLENGRPDAAAPAGDNVGLENIKILRDLKYHQQLYELLSKHYEMARLDEAKDASVIQVLDPAIEPERRVGPKRAVLVVVATVLAFFFAVSVVLLRELGRVALQRPRHAAKWRELKSSLSLR